MDGTYVLCMKMVNSAPDLGAVEHAHVTMGVFHSPPSMPPPPVYPPPRWPPSVPPPNLPPEFCITATAAGDGDHWCGASHNVNEYQLSDGQLISNHLGESRAPLDKWKYDDRQHSGWRMCDLDLLGCFQACFAVSFTSCHHVSYGGGESEGCCFLANSPCVGTYRQSDQKFYLTIVECTSRRSLRELAWANTSSIDPSKLRLVDGPSSVSRIQRLS